MTRYFYTLFVVTGLLAASSSAQAQNPPGSEFNPYPAGYVEPTYGSAYCYYGDGRICDQVIKRLERRFDTENEWGTFEVRNIPRKFAKRVQVSAVMQDGTVRYLVGSDSINNWWERAQLAPASTKALQFKYVAEDYNATVEIPVLIIPYHVGRELRKPSTATITLTENHFFNADFIKADLHHQRVQNEDGSYTDYIRTKEGKFVARK